MSEASRKLLVGVFGSLKQKVLWKWEGEDMPDRPGNVKLVKWLPQQDILGHQNTRLFVTHGGLNSFQETLRHQKPAVSRRVVLSVLRVPSCMKRHLFNLL